MFRLRRSKKILFGIYSLYLKRRKKLLPAQAAEIENELKKLEQAILSKESSKAAELAQQCRLFAETALRKGPLEKAKDFIFAIVLALAFALLIRQIWFELYEIPTGSMRPTLKEQDRLIVSKTRFGINVPFRPDHFYFNPDLMKRGDIVVFTVENMDVRDADTLYFYLFPGKKQFVKRLIGKPGDTLYFYGGKIFGIDREGNDLTADLQRPELASIDHIPFIRFEGNVKVSEPFRTVQGEGYRNAILHQMNEPVALLSVLSDHRLEGQMLSLRQIRSPDLPPLRQYGDLLGIKHYATARLATPDQAKAAIKKAQWTGEEGILYLEMRHSPRLDALRLSKDQWGRLRPRFELSRSYIPLTEEKARQLFQHLYTARFVVKNGFASRYSVGEGNHANPHFLPKMKNVPDGTYEFYDGIGYRIQWGGVATQLPPSHPLMKFSVDQLLTLFNLGIHFDLRAGSEQGGVWLDTERFAYFREGALFVMGAPLFSPDDPLLTQYVEKENQKREDSIGSSYPAFVDEGIPSMDIIRANGVLVPESMYLVLGDNHAMSADSRDFGFVPAANIRGAPSLIFWPPGQRFGALNQPTSAWFTLPNVVVWGLAAIATGVWWVYHRRKYQLPLKF